MKIAIRWEDTVVSSRLIAEPGSILRDLNSKQFWELYTAVTPNL